jgi:aminoglycoside phosphotransferase (APT) family kinase protein
LEGKNATLDRLANPQETAVTLANFITTLQQLDAAHGPAPGEHNSGRGVPLAERDAQTRQAIAALEGMIDTKAATAVWEAALELPAWSGAPVWLHGDLQSGNLLAVDGELTAVIDFGCLGVGDPACDLMVAWNLFSGEAREAFRTALAVDGATWARGRGWALSVGLIALPYYQHTNPVLAGISQYAIDEVLAEQKDGI